MPLFPPVTKKTLPVNSCPLTAERPLCRRAATIPACRNRGTARLVEEEIRSSGNDSVRSVELDLSDLRSVERCARVVTTSTDRLDVLINNSGAAFRSRTLTPQGFEQTFAVNYLSTR